MAPASSGRQARAARPGPNGAAQGPQAGSHHHDSRAANQPPAEPWTQQLSLRAASAPRTVERCFLAGRLKPNKHSSLDGQPEASLRLPGTGLSEAWRRGPGQGRAGATCAGSGAAIPPWKRQLRLCEASYPASSTGACRHKKTAGGGVTVGQIPRTAPTPGQATSTMPGATASHPGNWTRQLCLSYQMLLFLLFPA